MTAIFEKLLEIQKLGMTFQKKGINPHFKSSYLTLDDLLSKLIGVCDGYGILIYHTTENNNIVTHVRLGEEEITSHFPIGDVSNPQKIGSAITYAKRYNLGQIFNIVTDDDDDGNKASDAPKKDSFDKPNFGKRNLDNLKASIEKGERKQGKEETIKYLHANYNLKDDAEGRISEYFDRLPEVPDQAGTSVSEAFPS